MKGRFVLFLLFCWIICPRVSANPTVALGGRLDIDTAHYGDDVTSLESGVDLRRMRLEVGGKLTRRLSYYALADFSDGSYNAQASWLRYRFNPEYEIYAGRIENPFSLQQVSNSQFGLFMERALPAALTSHYGTGLVFVNKGRRWSWRAGIFADDELNFGGSKKSGPALALRFGRRLRVGASRLWLGASAMFQDPKGPERFQARPESTIADQSLVNTGRIAAVRSSSRAGIEAVWKAGAWSMQGEWIRYAGNLPGDENLVFDGAYVEASRIFGGRRRFNFRRGEWMSPEIGDKGGWEVAFRLSGIDLEDKSVSGGRETNYSIGLNYYFNPINRIMLNLIQVRAHPNKRGVDESPTIVQLRLQMAF